jgi:hypothetical protein
MATEIAWKVGVRINFIKDVIPGLNFEISVDNRYSDLLKFTAQEAEIITTLQKKKLSLKETNCLSKVILCFH